MKANVVLNSSNNSMLFLEDGNLFVRYTDELNSNQLPVDIVVSHKTKRIEKGDHVMIRYKLETGVSFGIVDKVIDMSTIDKSLNDVIVTRDGQLYSVENIEKVISNTNFLLKTKCELPSKFIAEYIYNHNSGLSIKLVNIKTESPSAENLNTCELLRLMSEAINPDSIDVDVNKLSVMAKDYHRLTQTPLLDGSGCIFIDNIEVMEVIL